MKLPSCSGLIAFEGAKVIIFLIRDAAGDYFFIFFMEMGCP
jgi:hypothetical protein